MHKLGHQAGVGVVCLAVVIGDDLQEKEGRTNAPLPELCHMALCDSDAFWHVSSLRIPSVKCP